MRSRSCRPEESSGADGCFLDMSSRHTAYGIELRASFELPGMSASSDSPTPIHAAARPRLNLELVSADELPATFSDADLRMSWTGVLGDGRSLTIECAADEKILFRYDERALYLFEPSKGRLRCAPLEAGLHWQQVLLCRVLPNIAIAYGYEALHASAVESPLGVLAIAAPTGGGKSTLAVELISRGWRLFTDDVLILGRTREGICAHPGTPHLNVAYQVHATIDRGLIDAEWDLLPGERWIALRSSVSEPRPVRLICLPERAGERYLRTRSSSTPLPLAPYMIGLSGDEQRERQRFALYGDLLGSAEILHLAFDAATSPAKLADAVEDALGAARSESGGGGWFEAGGVR
jgi:hypothetical protein